LTLGGRPFSATAQTARYLPLPEAAPPREALKIRPLRAFCDTLRARHVRPDRRFPKPFGVQQQ